jgi:PAS domain S-box-containing protein
VAASLAVVLHQARLYEQVRRHAEELTQRVQERTAALQESEERFRVLADNAPVLIWVNGLDGCEFVNHEYLRFLGVRDVDVRGYGWAQFVHAKDRDAYVTSYLNAVAQKSLFEMQVRFRRNDGEYRWMKSNG